MAPRNNGERRPHANKGGAQNGKPDSSILSKAYNIPTRAAGKSPKSWVTPARLRYYSDVGRVYALCLANALGTLAAHADGDAPAAACMVEAMDLVAQVDAVRESVYALAAWLESAGC